LRQYTPPKYQLVFSRHRYYFLVFILVAILLVILGRMLYLGQVEHGFLIREAKKESVRLKSTPVLRGMIYDRNGMPLAVSAPIASIIFNPKRLLQAPLAWKTIADNNLLGLNLQDVKAIIEHKPNSQFVTVKKGIPPQIASDITAMNVAGVYARSSQNTFFPAGASLAQLVGFTNVNNRGQSGLELSFNPKLYALNARKRYEVNGHGVPIAVTSVVHKAKYPKDLNLSIDGRLQFIAYEALKKEVMKAKATSGSVVILDPYSGEVLTAVSYPSFNPNIRSDRSGLNVKDRSITDIFEPGSVMKSFTLAAALESGKYTPDSTVQTSPGYYFINRQRIKDDSNFGLLDLAGIMIMSSNVGVSKIALSLPRKSVYNMFINAGFGHLPGGDFPGEARGTVHPLASLSKFEFATMTFGYHLNASLLQLARGYGAIANGGILYPVTFIKQNKPIIGHRIMTTKTAAEVRQLLERVVGDIKGTAILSNVPGYTVGGKTGTTQQVGKHGYDHVRTNAVFIGLAPIKHPAFVIAVRINAAMGGHYYRYGGVSAAPVFASIAGQAMHVSGVSPTKQSINKRLFKNQERFYKSIVGA